MGRGLNSILRMVGREIHIEAEPVKILAECLAVTLLSSPAIAAELKKVIFRGMHMIKTRISMMFVLKILFNFAEQPETALRQMPSYWSSSSKISIALDVVE